MLKFAKLLALVAIFWLGAAAPVARAEAAAGHAKADEDPIAFTGYQRWDLALYTLVVFGLVLLVLGKFAFPHIIAGLKKREGLIAQAKEDAIAAQNAAEEMRKSFAQEKSQYYAQKKAMMRAAKRGARKTEQR